MLREKEWEFEQILSTEFNRLKGKLFTLSETVFNQEDFERCKAHKRLIKDFCNEEYVNTIKQMRTFMRDMGHCKEEDIPISAEPLETK